MNLGIEIGDEVIDQPDTDQRARFVAGNLAHAILSDQESMCSALCSYLATRLPELKQVKIDNKDEEMTIEFIFDEDYKKQVIPSDS